jgi:hypothetical protein
LPDLRTGLSQLKRICALPQTVPPTANSPERQPALLQSIQATTDKLISSQEKTSAYLRRLESGLRQDQPVWCNALTAMLPICQVFEQRKKTLSLGQSLSDRMYSEARQRWDIYLEFYQLETQSCTRVGFTQKLLSIEQQHFLPLALGWPGHLEGSLSGSGAP